MAYDFASGGSGGKLADIEMQAGRQEMAALADDENKLASEYFYEQSQMEAKQAVIDKYSQGAEARKEKRDIAAEERSVLNEAAEYERGAPERDRNARLKEAQIKTEGSKQANYAKDTTTQEGELTGIQKSKLKDLTNLDSKLYEQLKDRSLLEPEQISAIEGKLRLNAAQRRLIYMTPDEKQQYVDKIKAAKDKKIAGNQVTEGAKETATNPANGVPTDEPDMTGIPTGEEETGPGMLDTGMSFLEQFKPTPTATGNKRARVNKSANQPDYDSVAVKEILTKPIPTVPTATGSGRSKGANVRAIKNTIKKNAALIRKAREAGALRGAELQKAKDYMALAETL